MSRKTKLKPVKPLPSIDLGLPLVMLVVSVMVFVSGWYSLYYRQKPAASPQKATSNWQKVPNPMALIYTPTTFQPRNKTVITIPLKFSGELPLSLLTLNSSASAKIQRMYIHHPHVAALNWTSVDDGSIWLYQKQKKYNSVQDFLKSPPSVDTVAITGELKNFPTMQKFKNNVLTAPIHSSVEYILTTYAPLKREGDYYLFSRQVDTTEGILTKNNSLGWTVDVPSASEDSPYFLGEVHIDYRY